MTRTGTGIDAVCNFAGINESNYSEVIEMKQFSRGQKSKLDDLGCGQSFNVDVELKIGGTSADVSCFGLDASERLSDDRYMVFYNQLASPGDAVKLTISGDRSSFAVNLAALPESISKLVFTAAIDATLDGDGSLAIRRAGIIRTARRLFDGTVFPR